MDAREARTLNIRDLVVGIGGPTRFANLYGHGDWTQAQVSQWVSAKAPRNIGHALARKIETELNLPTGGLDYYPMSDQTITSRLRVQEPRADYGDPDEIMLIELFRRMPKRKKRAILDLMNSESPPAEK